MLDLKIIDTYQEEMIEALASIVAIPSIASTPIRTINGELLPCGRPCHDALLHFLQMGEELGFTPYNAMNYGGHLEWSSNDSQEIFGIVGHLDVVPAGDSWDSDPFILRRDANYLYGRGTSDDKGPMIACLFALKALKEMGYKPSKTIRIIVGIDEETGMDSIDRYLELASAPSLGFTPDANFPLIIGEKGIFVAELAQKIKPTKSKDGLVLKKLQGGTAHNAVADNCKALIHPSNQDFENLLKTKVADFNQLSEHHISLRKQSSSFALEVKGISSHASVPGNGISAISIMMSFLASLEFNSDEINDFIDFYNQKIGFDNSGELLGLRMSDELSGSLTVNPGIISFNKDLIAVTLDIRYPVSVSGDTISTKLRQALDDTTIGSQEIMREEPIYMEPDSLLARELIKSYKNQSGETDAEPIVIGGGTYAKRVPGILAFGAMFPGDEDLMHKANEYITIDRFLQMTKIYAEAIYRLCFDEASNE